ncbi:spinster family MFS transporter [Polymorphobacter fuscus]|uniref:MFS transporter n=1 Tax=Sandarakinorhabdus fusca TaxID=1439888 RepID=A0A7C9GRS9_9SPHN|nr:MFS transporter [Polymorphobacter fuscus]KAB7646168.1 MFS transporter [Polymorphobacter fuscus]MQT17371.1 MFS transporter [Polymorphobacter fuscus]NJC10095.1 MFS family permease [Polymorphobacter fuscus]
MTGRETSSTAADVARPGLPPVGGAYAKYVLGVLMVVYIFNFIDRSILTILGPYIQKDLGLSDGQLGLLSGTVFALFYGLFGLALGKLADTWLRTRTIALGLAVWSGMTALSGFATNFGGLAAARVGVGVGEASASPAAYSLISDWFPKARRATALAIYSSGIFIGAGLSFAISGVVVEGWNNAFAPGTAPLGLAGWQAAFLIIGLPGVLLALLVLTLKEPPRGYADGLPAGPREPHPFRKTIAELGTVLPPFTLIGLRRAGASAGVIRANLLAIVAVVIAAILLTMWTDSLIPAEKLKVLARIGGIPLTSNAIQWASMALGVYGVTSWAQSLAVRDKPLFALTWGTPTFLQAAGAGTLISFGSYAVGAWVYIYAFRNLGATPATAGLFLGLGSAIGGWVGTSLGGIIGDAWRKRSPSGRLVVSLLASILPLPVSIFAFWTQDLNAFYIAIFLTNLISTFWLGGVTASMQDLVLPRMRGTAGAMFFLGTTMLGLGNGPYVVGLISDATGDLQFAIRCTFLAAPVVWLLLVLAIRGLPRAESTSLARARAAGEPV